MSSEQLANGNNMGIGASKESSKKEERKGLDRDIIPRIDEAVERYFVDDERERGRGRSNGGEFERRGRGNGRRYRELTPSPRERMSPDARERVERWLEGCVRARCDGYMQRWRGGEEDRGEVRDGGRNVNEDVDLEVENGELKGEEKEEIEEIGIEEEPGVSSR